MASDELSIVLTTVGTEQQAMELTEELIERHLATCVNMIPGVRSMYRWKGKVCEDAEYLLLIKTRTDLFDEVSAAIREIHAYELPEILAYPITHSEPVFHAWIAAMGAAAEGD